MEEKIKSYVLQALGIDRLPEREQEEAILRAGRIIFQAVLLRAIEGLDESDEQELDKLLTASPRDEERVLDFFKSKIPNLDEIVREEAERFRDEIGAALKKASA